MGYHAYTQLRFYKIEGCFLFTNSFGQRRGLALTGVYVEMLSGSNSEMGKSHRKPHGLKNVFISAIIIIYTVSEQLLADAEMGEQTCFRFDPYIVAVCSNYTFKPLFTVQL